ncbi:MAG: purine-nucleoside phosphorylase [Firmicutes bacterium HGW-Firmicutes-20]|jgi:purine-nucleoside phosphorylase|nr:MAG: purine-nucleoside phosphorylase [Firmicutes bacterium HGW-Firmicutes-20]
MSTPHNKAVEGQIAKTVLMPGDPLRAKFIAENFLENVEMFNDVRNMFGYTGTYKGHKISVMGSGMGMPSIGIYSYELYSFYGVENIIRIGSAGSYSKDVNLYDVVLADSAWSESSFALTAFGYKEDVMLPSVKLNGKLISAAERLNIPFALGRIHSSDVFYRDSGVSFEDIFKQTGSVAVEMESFALFANAKKLGKHAACLVTISDSLVTHEVTSPEERQNSFTKMMQIALEMAFE